MRDHEVARQILKHRRPGWIDGVIPQEFAIGPWRRLGFEIGGDDVEHRLEVLFNPKPRQNRAGMVGRAIGQDQLAPGQFGDRSTHRRVGLERRMIDLVHVSKVIVGAHAVFAHHAAHAGAVAAVIILLDDARFLLRDFQMAANEFADPLVDLLPQIDVMRIKRVVEIEHPGVDPTEGAFGRHHGIAKRSVLPPLDRSTAAKPVGLRPRVPHSPCSLISNLLSRVQSCVSPPQFSGLSLKRMVRLSASTASAKLKIRLGWPMTSGCRHLPGSMRYQPRLTTGLPSTGATAAITLCGVSLHQVRPVEEGACTASTMTVKKFDDCTNSGESPRLLRKAASAACVFGPSTPSIGEATKPAITR